MPLAERGHSLLFDRIPVASIVHEKCGDACDITGRSTNGAALYRHAPDYTKRCKMMLQALEGLMTITACDVSCQWFQLACLRIFLRVDLGPC
jgi:hypothetical protein